MLIRSIRSVFVLLKSDRTPVQIAVGFSLGLLIGLTPIGGHSLLLFALAVVAQCSLRSALLGTSAGLALKYPLAAPAYHLGVALLQNVSACRAAAAWLNDQPFLALSHYDRYWMFGSTVLAAALAGALFAPGIWIVRSYRARWSERIRAAAWYRKAHESRVVRALHWLFLGGTGPIPEPRRRPVWHPARYVRPPGIAVVAVLFFLLYGTLALGASRVVPRALKGDLSDRIGAPVEIESCALDPWTWNLSVRALRVPDGTPEHPDILRVGHFEAEFDVGSLLALRAGIGHLRAQDVALHIRREEDGSLNLERLKPQMPPKMRAAWEEWLEWVRRQGRRIDWIEAVRRLEDLLRRAREEMARLRPDPRELPFDPRAAADLARRSPLLCIGEISAKHVRIEIEDRMEPSNSLPPVHIVEASVRNLALPNPDRRPLEIALDVRPAESGSVRLDGRWADPVQSWNARIEDVALEPFGALVAPRAGLRPVAGLARFESRVAVRGDTLDGQAQLAVRGLRVETADPPQPLFGVDASLSPYVADGINAFAQRAPIAFAFRIGGTVNDPQFDWSVNWLEIAKAGLEALGERALESVIRQLDGEIQSLAKEHIAVAVSGEFEKVQQEMAQSLEQLPRRMAEDFLERINPFRRSGETPPAQQRPANPLERLLPPRRDNGDEPPNPLDWLRRKP